MNTDEVASSLLGNVSLLAATLGVLAATRVGAPKRNTVRMLLYSIFQISVCIAATSCMNGVHLSGHLPELWRSWRQGVHAVLRQRILGHPGIRQLRRPEAQTAVQAM